MLAIIFLVQQNDCQSDQIMGQNQLDRCHHQLASGISHIKFYFYFYYVGEAKRFTDKGGSDFGSFGCQDTRPPQILRHKVSSSIVNRPSKIIIIHFKFLLGV